MDRQYCPLCLRNNQKSIREKGYGISFIQSYEDCRFHSPNEDRRCDSPKSKFYVPENKVSDMHNIAEKQKIILDEGEYNFIVKKHIVLQNKNHNQIGKYIVKIFRDTLTIIYNSSSGTTKNTGTLVPTYPAYSRKIEDSFGINKKIKHYFNIASFEGSSFIIFEDNTALYIINGSKIIYILVDYGVLIKKSAISSFLNNLF